jgi:hypothetical protein
MKRLCHLRYHAEIQGALPNLTLVAIMKFEHLIEVNDPLNPLIDALSVQQVWRGLVLRAESPKLFVPHLDESIIDERTENGFRRRLRYGELEPMRSVRYRVAAQQDIAESSLTMTIETPTEDSLFVRFQYEDSHDAATDEANAMYDEFRRSAYVESDIDTIGMLRELAQTGRLDALLN